MIKTSSRNMVERTRTKVLCGVLKISRCEMNKYSSSRIFSCISPSFIIPGRKVYPSGNRKRPHALDKLSTGGAVASLMRQSRREYFFSMAVECQLTAGVIIVARGKGIVVSFLIVSASMVV